jgi:hypothetical protein
VLLLLTPLFCSGRPLHTLVALFIPDHPRDDEMALNDFCHPDRAEGHRVAHLCGGAKQDKGRITRRRNVMHKRRRSRVLLMQRSVISDARWPCLHHCDSRSGEGRTR